MAKDRRYWDSDAFIGFLKEEADKYAACESVLEAADQGRIVIVTSALTLAEVLWAKGHPQLPDSKKAVIEKFFKSPYISVENVTRHISENARDLVWDNGIRPKDAIHVATALHRKIPVLNTFDRQLLGKNKQIGSPPLCIEKPHEPSQNKLM